MIVEVIRDEPGGRASWVEADLLLHEERLNRLDTPYKLQIARYTAEDWSAEPAENTAGVVAHLHHPNEKVAAGLHRAVLRGVAALALIASNTKVEDYFSNFVIPEPDRLVAAIPPRAYYLSPDESHPLRQLPVQLGPEKWQQAKLKYWYEALRRRDDLQHQASVH
jgi:hypothetical protein